MRWQETTQSHPNGPAVCSGRARRTKLPRSMREMASRAASRRVFIRPPFPPFTCHRLRLHAPISSLALLCYALCPWKDSRWRRHDRCRGAPCLTSRRILEERRRQRTSASTAGETEGRRGMSEGSRTDNLDDELGPVVRARRDVLDLADRQQAV